VKINYTEVGILCSLSKDVCKNGCEQVFRFLSDKVRKGEPVAMEVPFVGSFIVRGGIAAFSFIDDLSEETKGVTAKNYFVNKLFSSSVNQLNLKVNDHHKNKQNPTLGLGGAMRITEDAEQWLRNNLAISVPDLGLGQSESRENLRVQSANNPFRKMNRYGSVRAEEMKNKPSWGGGTLTESNKHIFDRMSEQQTGPLAKRPMSAVTRLTSASRVTNVPEVGRMKLMLIANDLHRNRQAITETHLNSKG
jgi:CCDC81 eukaryotic HU domain 2